MLHRVDILIADASAARDAFLTALGQPTPGQSHFRPSPDAWSLADLTEHMTLAERSGTFGLWKALDGIAHGRPVWSGEPVHAGRPVEAIIAATWREKETVPPIAAPTWGAPIGYWIAALRGGHAVLEALGAALKQLEASGVALDTVIFPHPLSGPMDVWQRLEFLRFHLDRHREQVRAVRAHPAFAAA
ncbi:MAG: DinB family protein [Gemmatimonadaceae bacterium]|nr:DinB family protein [Gemmatimonadaceae bacterium]